MEMHLGKRSKVRFWCHQSSFRLVLSDSNQLVVESVVKIKFCMKVKRSSSSYCTNVVLEGKKEQLLNG